jgi:hypothetical protein
MWHLALSVLDRTLRIATDDEVVARYLHNAFRRLRCEEGEGVTDDAFIITRAAEPRIVFRGQVIRLSPDEAATPFSVALNGARKLMQHEFRMNADYEAWPAAGVDCGGGAVVLAAPAGTGKTTLMVELLDRGARFFGDEYVFVRKSDNIVVPFARSITVREPLLALFGNDSTIARACRRSAWRRTTAYRVWDYIDPIDAFGSETLAKPAPLRAAILLERGARTEIAPLSASVFALATASRTGAVQRDLEHAWDIGRSLRSVRCFRLTMKDISAAAQLVQDVALTTC